MKTGNNTKKTYTSPKFTMITIDSDISLVMATGNSPGEVPGDPSFDNKDREHYYHEDPFVSPFED
jgi:hypothetical protein